MKLTGNLKDKVESAESMEEAKDLISDAGMELTEDELENVTGGRKYAEVKKESIFTGEVKKVSIK